MLPLRCSRPSISVSKSSSFWPSTMARRRSSGCVALISMRFMCTPACPGRACRMRRPRARLTTRCTRNAAEPWSRNALDCVGPRSRRRSAAQRWRVRVGRVGRGCRRLPAPPRITRQCSHGGGCGGMVPGPGVGGVGRRGRHGLPLRAGRRHEAGRARVSHLEFSGPRVNEAGFCCDSLPPAPAPCRITWGPRPGCGAQALHHLHLRARSRLGPCAQAHDSAVECPGKLR